jgi:hypothetical protein
VLKQYLTGYLIGVALVAVVFLLTSTAHCAVGKKPSDTTCWLPEGCVIQYTENPYTYKVGTATMVGTPDGAFVVRIQPLGTFSLFTEDILFCDYKGVFESGMLANKHNPLVLTYHTRALRLVQGIGCHTLVRVDEMKTQEKIQ